MREKWALQCLKCTGQIIQLPQYLLRQFYSRNGVFCYSKINFHLIDWDVHTEMQYILRCIALRSMVSQSMKVSLTLIYLPNFPLKWTGSMNTVQLFGSELWQLNPFHKRSWVGSFFSRNEKKEYIISEKERTAYISQSLLGRGLFPCSHREARMFRQERWQELEETEEFTT